MIIQWVTGYLNDEYYEDNEVFKDEQYDNPDFDIALLATFIHKDLY